MSIQYNRLFLLLDKLDISKVQLKEKIGVSSATFAKLAKNEPVSMKVIDSICSCLHCQPEEILEYQEDKTVNMILQTLKEEKSMKLSGGLYHTTQIELTYNSNHIEGNKLSKDQTRYIFETHTISTDEGETADINDIVETSNHFRCIDYMIDCAEEPLSESIIKEFHRVLKTNTMDSSKDWFAVGDYKKRANMVGDSETTSPKQVAVEIKKLLAEYNKEENITFDDIVDFHYKFEKIYPFQDGNGRVGRLIIFKECLRFGITPFIIMDEKKLFYYRGLKEYPTEKGFLHDTCLDAQDNYQKVVDYFLNE